MPSPTNPQTSPAVLVIQEDTVEREQLLKAFANAGYRAFSVADSTSAFRLLQKEPCDLVVIDLALPGVDGLALCKLLRAQEATNKLPVIILSEKDVDQQRLAAFEAGADDCMPRASSAAEVLSRSTSHLRAAQRAWELIGSNRELRFLADLGRGLLRTLEPDQLVRRVAGATYEGTSAAMCAAVVNPGLKGEAVCVFDREGSAEGAALLRLDRLESWLTASSSSSVSPLLISDASKFMLCDEHHSVEYTSPLNFGGRSQGALVVAFDKREDCDDTVRRLVDAAAQQAALAVHISNLYQAARDASANLTIEVERRTAEVRAQERFIEAIVDSLPLSLYAIDRKFEIVAWNRNREQGELGIPRGSVLGKNIFRVLTRQKRELLEGEFKRVFESGEIQRLEHATASPNGEVKHWLISKIPMWIDKSGEVSHVIAIGEDITARVEANRAVARAEKLAAIGRLAAGVVHEINNPLATISACAEALESRVSGGEFQQSPALDDLREYLGLIRNEAFRCKTITNGLLDFSRTRATEHSAVNLGDVIASAARLLSHQQRADDVKIEIETAANIPAVSGDAGQLQQAVIALATNGIDAMPDGGVLKIASRVDDLTVLIEVSDTGVGIPQANITRIFEPFFTTKEIGKGTGLGLAVCYGILTEHGGSLDVQSTPGAGTVFTISLPAISNDGEPQI
ncbi:MAG TPA: ATP-binding protein [Pyrinomonadaceae bacterium]|nr:ATP-binding protein [Pyrinomonadaceae bacterium]